MIKLPKLYTELAGWWPVLSSPEDYAEEADFFLRHIVWSCKNIPKTMLELGSGGGNNASHLKNHFKMTLVDISPGMIEVSKKLNPECQHIQGDMRNIRLNRQFDAVFIHDAIGYMLSEDDLFSALETAYVHCHPGGVALFAPDHTRETYKNSTSHGGHDRDERSMRYLEWTYVPDPTDNQYISEMVYLLKDGDKVQSVYDRHVMGLFTHKTWLELIQRAGFVAKAIPFEHSELEPGSSYTFIGTK